MGTNYYWFEKSKCETCQRPYGPIHIGKSSAGWHFALHVMPEEDINDLDDWEILWNKPGSYINDEYGELITPENMKRIITKRKWHSKCEWTIQMYRSNQAEPGLNGLVRSIIDERTLPWPSAYRKIIKHGSGTWDCVIGEFF